MTEKIPHIVYDCSIQDLTERKNKAVIFESGNKAASYLGMKQQSIIDYTNIQAIISKKRYFSKKLGKEFCIRIAKQRIL